MKNVVLLSTFLNGKLILAFNATNVLFVCPHAVIRPVLMTDEEAAKAPETLQSKPAIGAKGLNFAITISPLDCTGCGNCAQVCPAPKGKALVMKPLESQLNKTEAWEYSQKEVAPKANPMNKKP